MAIWSILSTPVKTAGSLFIVDSMPNASETRNWLPIFCVLRKLSNKLSFNSVSNDITISPPAKTPAARTVKVTLSSGPEGITTSKTRDVPADAKLVFVVVTLGSDDG